MSAREAFEGLCKSVCEERDWEFDAGRLSVSFASGRHQGITFEHFAFEGQELVRLVSVIGSASRIDSHRLTQALRLNYNLPHGALALRGDALVMVDTLNAEASGAEEIAGAIAYLAETGDHFEASIFGPDEN
jgi:hypothetical protein